MTQNIILTGAFGSGKSTVLQLLKAQDLIVVAEPARQILAEQRSIGDEGVPEKNPKLFIQLLLSRAMYQYQQMQGVHDKVIFDRGVADNIAYAELFNLHYPAAKEAAKRLRYDTNVFFFPAWQEIYTTDEERTISFAAAKAFGDSLKRIYQECGYHLIEVPCVSPQERALFIRETILVNRAPHQK